MTLFRTCFKLLLSRLAKISFAKPILRRNMEYVKRQVRSFNIYCLRYPTLAYKLALASNWHRNPVLALLFFPLFVKKGKLLINITSVQAIYEILSDDEFCTPADREKVTVASFRRLDPDDNLHFDFIVKYLRLLPKLQIVSLNFVVDDNVLRAVARCCPELTILDSRLRRSSEGQQPDSPFDDALGIGTSQVLYFPPYDPIVDDFLIVRDFRQPLEQSRPNGPYISPAFNQFHADKTDHSIDIERLGGNPLSITVTVHNEFNVNRTIYYEFFNLCNSWPSPIRARYQSIELISSYRDLARHHVKTEPLPVLVTRSSLQQLRDLKKLHSILFNKVKYYETGLSLTGFTGTDVKSLLDNLSLQRLECNQYLVSRALELDEKAQYSDMVSFSLPDNLSIQAAHQSCPNVSRLSIRNWEDLSKDPESKEQDSPDPKKRKIDPQLGQKFPKLLCLKIEWVKGPLKSIGFVNELGPNLSSLELAKTKFTSEDIQLLGSICSNLRLLSLKDNSKRNKTFRSLLEDEQPKPQRCLLFPNLRVLYYELADPRGLQMFLHKERQLESLFLNFVNIKAFDSLMKFIFANYEASMLLPMLEIFYITPKFVCTATLVKQLLRYLPMLKYLHLELDDVGKVEKFILREQMDVELVNIFDEFREHSVHFDCPFF